MSPLRGRKSLDLMRLRPRVPGVCPLTPRAEALQALVDGAPRADLPALAGDIATALIAAITRAATPPAVGALPSAQDRAGVLLTVEEAALRLNVPTSWIYRHWKQLGFGQKLGHRTVRIEALALDRWATRQRPRVAVAVEDLTRTKSPRGRD